MDEIRILSVNVAQPRRIGEQHGEAVISAIGKRPVTGERIELGTVNLAGDAQSDLEHHGGPDKAVYAYPSDHWPWWETEQGYPCKPGAFGENLTLAGVDETSVKIGDQFAWGEALLEISQPRVPCHKFQLYSGRLNAGTVMMKSGRCGWYFRVLRTGSVPVAGGVLVRTLKADGPTVREAFFAPFDRSVSAAARRAMAELPALSQAWKRRLVA